MLKRKRSQSTVDLNAKRRKKQLCILLVGEGDFSYAAALVEDLKKKKIDFELIASELREYAELQAMYPSLTENINFLRKQGVKVQFGIDATKLKSHYPQQTFDVIAFNGLHVVHTAEDGYQKVDVRNLTQAFCYSARMCQQPGGLLTIGLPQPHDKQKRVRRFWQTYGIGDATQKSGYIQLNKHRLPDRYQHKVSFDNRSTEVAKIMRAYHFCHSNLFPHEMREKHPLPTVTDSQGVEHPVLFSQETQEDSLGFEAGYASDTGGYTPPSARALTRSMTQGGLLRAEASVSAGPPTTLRRCATWTNLSTCTRY